MITNIKFLKRYCKDYTQIENYSEAVKSTLRYDLHHRLEIDEMQSVSDLKFLHLYYNRPPEELIFLEHGEHISLHRANLSQDTRQKMSDAKKNMSAETRQKISDAKKGKHPSEETRNKISDACKNPSAETRQKMSESKKGRHWHIENGHRVLTD